MKDETPMVQLYYCSCGRFFSKEQFLEAHRFACGRSIHLKITRDEWLALGCNRELSTET